MPPLRLIFMGTPEFACPTLRMLIERGEEIVAVVSQPDRPKGTGAAACPAAGQGCGGTAWHPGHAAGQGAAPDAIEAIRALAPDLIVVIAFGQILPKALLEIPRYGCINVHASLLPRYRGAAPHQLVHNQRRNGDRRHHHADGRGAGHRRHAGQENHPDRPGGEQQRASTTAWQSSGPRRSRKPWTFSSRASCVPEKQDDALTCYASMLKKEDGLIDWSKEPQAIKNLVRGMTPWPGAFTCAGRQDAKDVSRRHAERFGHPRGRSPRPTGTGLEVACGSGSVLHARIAAGRAKRLRPREFLAGCKMEPGAMLGKAMPPVSDMHKPETAPRKRLFVALMGATCLLIVGHHLPALVDSDQGAGQHPSGSAAHCRPDLRRPFGGRAAGHASAGPHHGARQGHPLHPVHARRGDQVPAAGHRVHRQGSAASPRTPSASRS